MEMIREFSLRTFIERRAQETPEAVAILAPGRQSLTYSGLLGQLDRSIKAIRDLGIRRNDRVAIVLPNGPEMAVVFLAVAACATSAPLNPNYRSQEFEFYLSDLNVRALILGGGPESSVRGVASRLGIPVLNVNSEMDEPAGLFHLTGMTGFSQSQDSIAETEDVALVLHTSGTTSRPKIVPLTHRNIGSSALHIRASLNLSPQDRCLNIMPLFHIHGLIGATLSSLAAGGSVICTPGFYATNFFEWMQIFQPTWYTAVPTMHQAILARSAQNLRTIDKCPLRFIRSSSAALPPQVLAGLENVFKAPVIEAYGMTEASHQMASNPLPPRMRKPGSAGLAAGPEIAIMDESGIFLPPSKAGEIVIRGLNVTCGYQNNPAANQSAFTNGWFRTGDQGYLDSDGYLFITGRIKELINRGGEKISPREVDEVLMDHPAVAQAVCFAVPHWKLGEEVCAAVVLKEGVSAGSKEIQEFAARRLTDFKVPRQIVIVDEIPKGPTGKLQRLGLAERLGVISLDPEPSAERPELVAPCSALQKDTANLWSAVLGVRPIGIHDHFFQLGGDSVLAMQLLSRIREAFDVDLSILKLFEFPTLAACATAIVEAQAECLSRDEMTRLMRELEGLSDEAAERLLGEESPAHEPER